MQLFVTGGGGVLGRALGPVAAADGHDLSAPSHRELDLYDADAVARAVSGAASSSAASRRISGASSGWDSRKARVEFLWEEVMRA